MRKIRFQLSSLLLTFFVLPFPACSLSSSLPFTNAAVNPASPLAREKYALLVGINEYPYLPVDNQLKSCVNDVKMMRETLVKKFDFKNDPDHITELTNKDAKRAAILTEFRNLIKKASENRDAVVVFHFSGHGSKVKDENGDEARDNNDPKDTLDEALVPHDSRQEGSQVFDIIDDEINQLVAELKRHTRHITLIFDTCHSHTASRALLPGADDAEIREVIPDKRTQPEQTPLNQLPAPRATPGDNRDGLISERGGYVELSASRAEEVARALDHGGVLSGALTFYLTNALNRSLRNTTYRELMENVSLSVNNQLPNQHPQVEGDIDQLLFAGTANDSQPQIEVEPTNTKVRVATIKAGAAGYGVKEGMLVALYQQNGQALNGASNQPITGKITAGGVSIDKSLAALSEETIIPPGTKSVFVSSAFSNSNLRVWFKSAIPGAPGSDPFADISRRIDRQPPRLKLVDRASSEAVADVTVMLGRFGDAFRDKDGKPFTDPSDKRYFAPEEPGQERPLPALDENVFYLTAKNDGRPLFGYFARLSDPQAGFRTLNALEIYVRHRNLKALVNEASPLRGKVKIKAIWIELKQDPNRGGRMIETEVALPPQNEYVAKQRERYRFVVENNSQTNLFITVVDISNDGKIQRMYSPKVLTRDQRGQVIEAKPLRPGEIARVPVNDADEDGFAGLTRPVGTETFKVIATTSYVDFEFLNGVGVRLREVGQSSSLVTLLASFMGNLDRDVAGGPLSLNDWVTTQIDFKISDVVISR